MSTLRALKTQQSRKAKPKKSMSIFDIAKKDQLAICAIFQKISKTTSNGKKQWKKMKKYIDVILGQEDEYEDPAFPPNNKTLTPLKNMRSSIKFISWFRAHNFFKNKKYFVFGDFKILNQSMCSKGFRYVIDGLNTLSCQPGMISRLFERKKTSKEGIYSVWLNINGKWTNIIIDDFMPIFRDKRNKTNFFLTSPNGDNKVIWYCLIEKALAKAYGGYDKLYGGLENYLIRDLTGAPYTIHKIPKIEKGKIKKVADLTSMSQLTSQIKKVMKKGHLISLTPRQRPPSKGKKLFGQLKSSLKSKRSIFVGHNFALVCMKEVKDSKGKNVRIAKLRNPYSEDNWKGEWSEKSKSWTYELKKKMAVEERAKVGEFWMSIKDIMTHFQSMNIYKISPGYCYNWVEINTLYQKYDRIVLRVKVPETGKYTFSVDQVDLRTFDNTALKYSEIKLTLGKLTHNCFKLLSHTSSSELRNSYIRKVLQSGEYYLLVEKKNSRINMKYSRGDDKKYSKLKKMVVSSYGPKSCGIVQVEENQDNQVVYDYLCYHGWKDYSKNKPGKKLSEFKVNFYDGSWHNLSLHLLDIPDSVIYVFRNTNEFGVELKSEINGIKHKEILGPHGRISYNQNFVLNPNSTDIFIIRKEQGNGSGNGDKEKDGGNFQINSIVGKKFDGVKNNPVSFGKVYDYLLNLKVPISKAEIEKDESFMKEVGIYNVEKGCVKIENERFKMRKDSGNPKKKDKYEDIVEILESARCTQNLLFKNISKQQEKGFEDSNDSVKVVAQDINIVAPEIESKDSPSKDSRDNTAYIEHELSDLIEVSKKDIANIDQKKLKDLLEFYGFKQFINLFGIKNDTIDQIANKFRQDRRISEMINQYLESTDYQPNPKEMITRTEKKSKKLMESPGKRSRHKSDVNFEDMMERNQRNVILQEIGKMKDSMKSKLKTRQRIPSMQRYQLDTSRGGDSSVSYSNRISVDKNNQRLDLSSLGKSFNRHSPLVRNRGYSFRNEHERGKKKMKLKVKSRSPNSKRERLKRNDKKIKEELSDVIKDMSDERGSSDKKSSSYFGTNLQKIKKPNNVVQGNLRDGIKKKMESIKDSEKRIMNIASKSLGRKFGRGSSRGTSEALDVDNLKYPESPNYNTKLRYSIELSQREKQKILKNRNRGKSKGSNSERIQLKRFPSEEPTRNNPRFFNTEQVIHRPSQDQIDRTNRDHHYRTLNSDNDSAINFQTGTSPNRAYTQREKVLSTSRNRQAVYKTFEEKPIRNSMELLSLENRNKNYLSNQKSEPKTQEKSLLFYSKAGQNLNHILSQKNLHHKTTEKSKRRISMGKPSTTSNHNLSSSLMRRNQSRGKLDLSNSHYNMDPVYKDYNHYINDERHSANANPFSKKERERRETFDKNPGHRRQYSDEALAKIAKKSGNTPANFTTNMSFKTDQAWDTSYRKSPKRLSGGVIDNMGNWPGQRAVSSSLQFKDTEANLEYNFLAKKNSNEVGFYDKRTRDSRFNSLVTDRKRPQQHSKVFDNPVQKKGGNVSTSMTRDLRINTNIDYIRPNVNQRHYLTQGNTVSSSKNTMLLDSKFSKNHRKGIRKSPSFTNKLKLSKGTIDSFNNIKKFAVKATPKNSNQGHIGQVMNTYSSNKLAGTHYNRSSYIPDTSGNARYQSGNVKVGANYINTPTGMNIKDFFGNIKNSGSLLQPSNLISSRDGYVSNATNRSVRMVGDKNILSSAEGLRIVGYSEKGNERKSFKEQGI